MINIVDQAEKGGGGGGWSPDGKFTKLSGKVNFGVVSSKLNVIRAETGHSFSF